MVMPSARSPTLRSGASPTLRVSRASLRVAVANRMAMGPWAYTSAAARRPNDRAGSFYALLRPLLTLRNRPGVPGSGVLGSADPGVEVALPAGLLRFLCLFRDCCGSPFPPPAVSATPRIRAGTPFWRMHGTGKEVGPVPWESRRNVRPAGFDAIRGKPHKIRCHSQG